MKITARTLLGGLLCAVFLSGCNEEESIMMVGIDADGKFVQELVKISDYQKNLAELATTIHDSTTLALNTLPQDQASSFQLQDVIVGLGAEVSFKIRHVISLASSGRLRFVFSPNNDTVIP